MTYDYMIRLSDKTLQSLSPDLRTLKREDNGFSKQFCALCSSFILGGFCKCFPREKNKTAKCLQIAKELQAVSREAKGSMHWHDDE